MRNSTKGDSGKMPQGSPGPCGYFYLKLFIMNFLEKDLETILFETDNKHLRERGLKINGKKKRQLRIGNYGVADIVSFNRVAENFLFDRRDVFNITVYELKQNKIDANTLMQCVRYCKGIERYLIFRGKKCKVQFNMVLIGKELSKGDFCYITSFFNNLDIYTYSYEFDGIRFANERNYSLTNEGFIF